MFNVSRKVTVAHVDGMMPLASYLQIEITVDINVGPQKKTKKCLVLKHFLPYDMQYHCIREFVMKESFSYCDCDFGGKLKYMF